MIAMWPTVTPEINATIPCASSEASIVCCSLRCESIVVSIVAIPDAGTVRLTHTNSCDHGGEGTGESVKFIVVPASPTGGEGATGGEGDEVNKAAVGGGAFGSPDWSLMKRKISMIASTMNMKKHAQPPKAIHSQRFGCGSSVFGAPRGTKATGLAGVVPLGGAAWVGFSTVHATCTAAGTAGTCSALPNRSRTPCAST